MTVLELTKFAEFSIANLSKNSDTAISQVFCCDLLSVAMGHAPADCAWVTVMNNINTLAVASLADSACVVLAEGIVPDDSTIAKAAEQNITVLLTPLPIFEAALFIHTHL